eukprot:1160010-Pelagomonas_calceolata.AAC.6
MVYLQQASHADITAIEPLEVASPHLSSLDKCVESLATDVWVCACTCFTCPEEYCSSTMDCKWPTIPSQRLYADHDNM